MNVDLGFAIRVQRLARQNIRIDAIAARLNGPTTSIMEALTALGLPMPGESIEPRTWLSDDERAALRGRMPKRMQDRMARIAKGGK